MLPQIYASRNGNSVLFTNWYWKKKLGKLDDRWRRVKARSGFQTGTFWRKTEATKINESVQLSLHLKDLIVIEEIEPLPMEAGNGRCHVIVSQMYFWVSFHLNSMSLGAASLSCSDDKWLKVPAGLIKRTLSFYSSRQILVDKCMNVQQFVLFAMIWLSNAQCLSVLMSRGGTGWFTYKQLLIKNGL